MYVKCTNSNALVHSSTLAPVPGAHTLPPLLVFAPSLQHKAGGGDVKITDKPVKYNVGAKVSIPP